MLELLSTIVLSLIIGAVFAGKDTSRQKIGVKAATVACVIEMSLTLSGCYSYSDIESARKDGYEEGYNEGYATGYEVGEESGAVSAWEEFCWEYDIDPADY